MPPARIRFRTLALVVALYAGGYALAIAQPEAAPQPSRPAAPAAKTAEPAAQPPAPPADELADSPLLVEPKTPGELFDAAILTDRLYRPALTKRYLEKLLQSNPSEEVLLDMRTKYGSATFLHLAEEPALKPAGGQLLDRMLSAIRKHEEDPAFLDSLIEGLQRGPADRDTSIQMLTNIGPSAVPRMLKHLAAPKPNEEHGVLVQSLAKMGTQVLPVLCGAVDAKNEAIRTAAIQALGLMQSKTVIPYLLDPAFDNNQPAGIRSAARTAIARILDMPTDKGDGVSSFGAVDELKKMARNGLANRLTWPTTDGKTDLWTWNNDSQTLVHNRVAPNVASLYTGLQFAHQAISLAPEDREAQVLFLALDFAWDALSPKEIGSDGIAMPAHIGPGTPHNLALTAGPDVAADTLNLGLKTGNPAVSLGALHALEAVGARQEVYGTRGARSPLLAALNDPNPEVQYAAAVAILRSNPETPFRGAQRVVDVLTRAISGTPSPFAVVIDANRERGNEMAGVFTQIGFESAAAGTGRQGFQMAVERNNVVLVVVQANVIRWPLSQTIANLRADTRSAQIPIVIYGPESVRTEIRGLLAHYPQVEYLGDAMTSPNVELQVGGFLKRALAMAAPPANRAERVLDATSWLAAIANGTRGRVFNLEPAESALMLVSTDRAFFANALRALGAIPTAAVQRHFEQLVTSERLDPAIREAAARHLADHIQHHGLLLTGSEVAAVEGAWRGAKTPELETALAAVMGSLKPNAKRVGTRFQHLPVPVLSAP